ncbi:hypothetical protein [Rubritalea tangerina]|uniref:hypothetical protein n=1 Tax=Rubritalea tangerina TaxID=430798 RepID=UPI0036221764
MQGRPSSPSPNRPQSEDDHHQCLPSQSTHTPQPVRIESLTKHTIHWVNILPHQLSSNLSPNHTDSLRLSIAPESKLQCKCGSADGSSSM